MRAIVSDISSNKMHSPLLGIFHKVTHGTRNKHMLRLKNADSYSGGFDRGVNG